MSDPQCSLSVPAGISSAALEESMPRRVVLIVENVSGEWRVRSHFEDTGAQNIALLTGPKDHTKLQNFFDESWHIVNASGFEPRAPTSMEGPSPVDRVVVVLEHG